MRIKGLPDPPFKCDRMEYRQAIKGDTYLFEGQWLHAYGHHIPTFIIAIPVKLTGIDWLEAQKVGVVFEHKGEWYVMTLTRGNTPHRQCVPVVRMLDWAEEFYSSPWEDMDVCFPHGVEDLSDETCEIKCEGIM